MSFKSIFCVIGIDQCDRDILNAIHLCKELDAHLSVLIVSLAPFPMGGYGVVVSPTWLLEREADIAVMKKREKQITSLVQNATSRPMSIAIIVKRIGRTKLSDSVPAFRT